MKKLILFLVAIVALQACSKKIDATAIANTKWVLSEWPGQAIPTDAQATLNFDAEKKIGGKSFCNSYGGNSSINGSKVIFSEIFSTKMFCSAWSNAEQKFQSDLAAVNSIKLSKAKLQLLKDKVVVMTFVKEE